MGVMPLGSTTAVFNVKLSQPNEVEVQVKWSTRDGIAVAGEQYVAANGTLHFLPGETEKQISVVILGQEEITADTMPFFIDLKPPINAVLGTPVIEARIIFEDQDGVVITTVVTPQGKQGQIGDAGMNAYELAIQMGEFDGTLIEWMEEQANAAAAAQRAITAKDYVEAQAPYIAAAYDVEKVYQKNERVTLENGDIVRCVVDDNENDPNEDMTGWVDINAASQIKDASGKDQQELNNDLKALDNGLLYIEKFNVGMELDIDPLVVFRRARDYAVANGIKVLNFRGNYIAGSSKEPFKWVMPFDDGSLPTSLVASDENGILPPEEMIEMDVALWLPSGMILRAENRLENSLDFGWNFYTGGVNTSQRISILRTVENWDGTYLPNKNGSNRYTKFVKGGGLEGFTLKNAFIGELCDGVRFEERLGHMGFEFCGKAQIQPGADQCTYQSLYYNRCYGGYVSGGWWLQRAANSYGYMPDGIADVNAIGWNDAVRIGFMQYNLATNAANIARMEEIDEFFDTYFFKTQNHETRLSTTRDGTNPAILNTYTGVASRAIWASTRQNRENSSCKVDVLKVYGSTRPPVYSFGQFDIGELYAERIGCIDRSASNNADSNMYYKNYTDKYLSNTEVFSIGIESSARTTIQSKVDRVTKHNTYNVALVNAAVGAGQKDNFYAPNLSRVRFSERTLNLQKVIEDVHTQVGNTPTSITSTVYHFFSSPRHRYVGMPYTWRSRTYDEYYNSGEIGFTSFALPSSKVTPTNTIKVRLSTVDGTEYDATGKISYTEDRGQVIRANVRISITADLIAESKLIFINLPGLPAAKDQTTVTYGSTFPNLRIVRLPSGALEPKACTVNVAADGKVFLRMAKDYSNSAGYSTADFSSAGVAEFILEYAHV